MDVRLTELLNHQLSSRDRFNTRTPVLSEIRAAEELFQQIFTGREARAFHVTSFSQFPCTEVLFQQGWNKSLPVSMTRETLPNSTWIASSSLMFAAWSCRFQADC